MSLIYGHRGASGYAPENTLEAFRLAMEMGADGFELDVHMSKDGALVVIHDESVDRTTDGTGLVRDLTLAQLKTLDASCGMEAYKGAKIPTLDEVFDLIRDTRHIVNVEVKTDEWFYPQIEEKCLALAKEKGVEDRILYSSFNHYTAASATAIEDCYEQFHYSTKVTYNEDCTSGTTTVTQHLTTGETKTKDSSFEIDQGKFSFLDNEQILFALRGMRNSTTSAKVNVYNPFVLSVQKVAVTVNSDVSESFSFYKNGSAEKESFTITYRPVQFVLDEKNPGATQTAWIAKAIDASKNTHRNVMLQLETPLSYGLGTLVYKLNSVSYQEL